MTADISPLRVLVKALCLFAIINVLYALIDPQGSIVFGYSVLFPGRTRLPFGVAGDPYTVTVDGVDAMFASHAISARKSTKEYRVALIGDSSVWGEDMGADEMISEQWNTLNIQCEGRTIKTYNLGYPHPSILKDLVILDEAVEYDPDLIIWFVTLNTLISQRINPFLAANQERVLAMAEAYDIPFELSEVLREYEPDFYEKTLVGQRSNLARQIKLQTLGIIWAATGADSNPLSLHNDLPNSEISDNPRYHGMQPPADIRDLLLFNALAAGYDLADAVPVLIVNEPVFIASKEHSSVRYNTVYPRWVYDQYREYMAVQAQDAGWNYLDLWNAVPPEYFSDAGLHLSIAGERLLIRQLNPALQSIGCNPKPQND
ncbi:MAG: hypothetical protein JW730_10910 [Anaerolineales bacterium]|nr:hypothetical protein [Anaerolineales bacterium]